MKLNGSGTVRIDGVAVSGPNRNGIMISQHGSVFPWLTVQENVMFGLTGASAAERMERAHRYIAMVGLSGFETAYPHELSGGMLKRVELAREPVKAVGFAVGQAAGTEAAVAAGRRPADGRRFDQPVHRRP